MKIENYHAITARYLGPTNTQGTRVKIISHRFKDSVIIPFDYSCNNITEIAYNWLAKRGYDIIGAMEISGKDDILISSTFRALKGNAMKSCPLDTSDDNRTTADSVLLPNGLCVYHNYFEKK